jgi:hypothetical protein
MCVCVVCVRVCVCVCARARVRACVRCECVRACLSESVSERAREHTSARVGGRWRGQSVVPGFRVHSVQGLGKDAHARELRGGGEREERQREPPSIIVPSGCFETAAAAAAAGNAAALGACQRYQAPSLAECPYPAPWALRPHPALPRTCQQQRPSQSAYRLGGFDRGAADNGAIVGHAERRRAPRRRGRRARDNARGRSMRGPGARGGGGGREQKHTTPSCQDAVNNSCRGPQRRAGRNAAEGRTAAGPPGHQAHQRRTLGGTRRQQPKQPAPAELPPPRSYRPTPSVTPPPVPRRRASARLASAHAHHDEHPPRPDPAIHPLLPRPSCPKRWPQALPLPPDASNPGQTVSGSHSAARSTKSHAVFRSRAPETTGTVRYHKFHFCIYPGHFAPSIFFAPLLPKKTKLFW